MEEQFSKDYFRCSCRRCSVKEVFLKVLQNSQESTCVGLSFYIRNHWKQSAHRALPLFIIGFHFQENCIDCSCHLSFLFHFFFFSFWFFGFSTWAQSKSINRSTSLKSLKYKDRSTEVQVWKDNLINTRIIYYSLYLLLLSC